MPRSLVSKSALLFGFAEAHHTDFAHQQALEQSDWDAARKAADDQCWDVAQRGALVGQMLPWLSIAEVAIPADVPTDVHQLAGDDQHMAALLPQKGCATGGNGWAGQIAEVWGGSLQLL